VSLIYPGKRLIPLKLRALLDFATPRLQERLAVVQAQLGTTFTPQAPASPTRIPTAP
jgi:hypothetical protein